ncbi:hypothetical protein [Alcanivorax sp. DP30]|uniref:hypothetical protein n=1 Tax=Alcanivorax sp. DP30 TaxID=2606217 RepID=UPI0013713641|nr:hypothetical protein [Alcanivorax sp. DP30]MZR62556.1 hypothetical protein [Alcanivorax sp. DP30]
MRAKSVVVWGALLLLSVSSNMVSANPYPESSCEHLIHQKVRESRGPNLSDSDRAELIIDVNLDALVHNFGRRKVGVCRETLAADYAQAEPCIKHYAAVFDENVSSDFEAFREKYQSEMQRKYPSSRAREMCMNEMRSRHSVAGAFGL